MTDPFLGMGCEFRDRSFSQGGGARLCDRAFFRDGVASFVTDPFLGMGCEFCDRPFSRDGVASFVTPTLFGMVCGLR